MPNQNQDIPFKKVDYFLIFLTFRQQSAASSKTNFRGIAVGARPILGITVTLVPLIFSKAGGNPSLIAKASKFCSWAGGMEVQCKWKFSGLVGE